VSSVLSIDRPRLTELLARERRRFAERNPRSRELFAQAHAALLRGVPMSWMGAWAGGYPIFLREARGTTVTDADGNAYVDFCLGDTGAMAGHAPEAVARAVARQYRRGTTAMLPTEDAEWVGRELARRFGVEIWQFSLTATDANRWVLRLARAITHRPKVLVFNQCYHGTVDEAVISLDASGRPQARPGNIGPAVDPTLTTKVIEFNDLAALERALAPGDVACLLMEPALTNMGIVLPDPRYHDAVRELTRRFGTLLVIDETHTFCSGPGGYTRAHGLQPDFVTVGKAIGGGIPIGAFGMRREIADRIVDLDLEMDSIGAVGGTLAGNALSLAAARATLEHVLTGAAFARMTGLAERLEAAVREVFDARDVPWHVIRLGARTEYRYSREPPHNGRESALLHDAELDAYVHCYLLNRGILTTPFHNMALTSPATTETDVDRYTAALADAIDELLAVGAAR
jgi:glutamate-1-semialdehyde 2,1-aminomutase